MRIKKAVQGVAKTNLFESDSSGFRFAEILDFRATALLIGRSVDTAPAKPRFVPPSVTGYDGPLNTAARPTAPSRVSQFGHRARGAALQPCA